MNSATEDFRRISQDVIDYLLAQDPVGATWLGDHRFDHELPDLSEANIAKFAVSL